MRALALVLLTCGAVSAWATEDAGAIVRRSLARHDHNVELAKDYTYREHAVVTEYGDDGRMNSSHSRTHDVVWLYGRPYSRLVEKDGRKLSPREERKEEERERKELERRRKAAEQADSRERREYEKRQAERRKMIDEIDRAFTFRIAGDDVVSGRPVYVIDGTPRPTYEAHDRLTHMLSKFRGRLWIDKADHQWVKVEAQVTGTISFGWFLARLGPGSSLLFEQRRVNDELWLPSEARINIDGRLAVFKKIRQGVVITFSDYRKFQADSRVITVGRGSAAK